MIFLIFLSGLMLPKAKTGSAGPLFSYEALSSAFLRVSWLPKFVNTFVRCPVDRALRARFGDWRRCRKDQLALLGKFTKSPAERSIHRDTRFSSALPQKLSKNSEGWQIGADFFDSFSDPRAVKQGLTKNFLSRDGFGFEHRLQGCRVHRLGNVIARIQK